MVVLFLYQRLYQTAERQLESLKKLDFNSLEDFTSEREDVTRELCESLEQIEGRVGDACEDGSAVLSEPVRRKIHSLTTRTLGIDCEIRERLMDELKERTLALSAALDE